MLSFSATTLKCLKKAGWHPGRQVKIDDYIAFLQKCGNPVHEVVRMFLVEFGRLVIKHPHPLNKKDVDYIQTDPFAADGVYFFDGDGLDDYNEETGYKLCTIGLAFHDNMLLLMANNGTTFGAVATELYKLGDSGEEAIEKLCTGTVFPEDLED